MADEYLSLREAAARAGRAPGTLRRYIKAGRLAAQKRRGKFGLEYRIRQEDVDRLQLEQTSLPARIPEAVPAPAELGEVLTKFVPVSVYNDLAAKHERLLIEYGMLRGEKRAVPGGPDSELERLLDQKEREVRNLKSRTSEEEDFLRNHLREAEEEIREKEAEITILREKVNRLEERFLEDSVSSLGSPAAGEVSSSFPAERAHTPHGRRRRTLDRLHRWLEVCQREMETG